MFLIDVLAVKPVDVRELELGFDDGLVAQVDMDRVAGFELKYPLFW